MHMYRCVARVYACMRPCVHGGYVYFDIEYGLNRFAARTKNFRVV